MERRGFFREPIEFYSGHIPFIIPDLITQIIKIQGQNSKILFNKESADDKLENIMDELESKRIINWSDYNNPGTLSVCLSLYIDTLFKDEPLITENIQKVLLSTQVTDSPSYLKLLRNNLLKLYVGRYRTLSYLIDFLSRIYFLSEEQLFKIFSVPFFGEKSLKINRSVLNELFQILLHNYCIIFQNSISEESFLTDEQIDILIKEHNKGKNIKSIHKEGNLAPKLIDKNESEQIINDNNSHNVNGFINSNQKNKSKKKKFKDANLNESIDTSQPYRSNLNYEDTITQTDYQQSTRFSLSNNMIIFKSNTKIKKGKKETIDSNNDQKNDSPIILSRKKEYNSSYEKNQISLQINQPFVVELIKHSKPNNSSHDDISESESSQYSSSKTISSSATSSTTSSSSFYSFSRLEAQLQTINQYGQAESSTIQIRNNIPNATDNTYKNNTKTRRNRKKRNYKDRSDTSDNISYSENLVNNNYENIPKPPPIPDYVNSDRHGKKTNYATNHNFNNNYFYADNSSENNTNNYSENRENDKSDSQNGVEIKFDFYKNLANPNTNEFLPPPPMLDPALLTVPIFGDSSQISQNYNNNFKSELPPITSDQLTTENLNEDENDKHVSFHLQSGLNVSEKSIKNNEENNSTSTSNIEESDSSLASSCKKEEEDKQESCKEEEEEETKKPDDEKEKKTFLYKYFKRKNEKKTKDKKKIGKDKSIEDEKDKKDKIDKKHKIDKKEKKDKKSKKK